MQVTFRLCLLAIWLCVLVFCRWFVLLRLRLSISFFDCLRHVIIIKMWRRLLWLISGRQLISCLWRVSSRLSALGYWRSLWRCLRWWRNCRGGNFFYWICFWYIINLKWVTLLVHWNRCDQVLNSSWLWFLFLKLRIWSSLLLFGHRLTHARRCKLCVCNFITLHIIGLDLVIHNYLTVVADAAGLASLITTEYVRILTTCHFPTAIFQIELGVGWLLPITVFLCLLFDFDWRLPRVSIISIGHVCVNLSSSKSATLTTGHIWIALAMMVVWGVQTVNNFVEKSLWHLTTVIQAYIICIVIYFLDRLQRTQLFTVSHA